MYNITFGKKHIACTIPLVGGVYLVVGLAFNFHAFAIGSRIIIVWTGSSTFVEHDCNEKGYKYNSKNRFKKSICREAMHKSGE